MSSETEFELGRRMVAGDVEARNELVRHTLQFVTYVARRYVGPSASFDDLIQVGNLGLLKATEHFDPERGIRFVSYAAWWIRAYLSRFCAENRSHVKRGKKYRVSALDISMEASESDGCSVFGDTLAGTTPAPDAVLLSKELDQQVSQAITSARKRIGTKGWEIIEKRLMTDRPVSLENIALEWGVSRECVRINEVKTKLFLSRYLAEVLVSEPSSR